MYQQQPQPAAPRAANPFGYAMQPRANGPPPSTLQQALNPTQQQATQSYPAVKYVWSDQRQDWIETQTRIRVPNPLKPFAKGGMRECFDVDEIDEDGSFIASVAKFFKQDVPDLVQADYFNEAMAQNMSETFAQNFERESRGVDIRHTHISFLMCNVVRINAADCPPQFARGSFFSYRPQDTRDVIFAMEPKFRGKFTKYNSNFGDTYEVAKERLDPEEANKRKEVFESAEAFSHFTLDQSGGSMLVCDLQGVLDFFTDPQIHTEDGKGLGMGNMGQEGINKWCERHKCNAICRALGLRPMRSDQSPLMPQPSSPKVAPTPPLLQQQTAKQPLPPPPQQAQLYGASPPMMMQQQQQQRPVQVGYPAAYPPMLAANGSSKQPMQPYMRPPLVQQSLPPPPQQQQQQQQPSYYAQPVGAPPPLPQRQPSAARYTQLYHTMRDSMSARGVEARERQLPGHQFQHPQWQNTPPSQASPLLAQSPQQLQQQPYGALLPPPPGGYQQQQQQPGYQQQQQQQPQWHTPSSQNGGSSLGSGGGGSGGGGAVPVSRGHLNLTQTQLDAMSEEDQLNMAIQRSLRN